MGIYKIIKMGTFESLMALLFRLRERYSHVPIALPILPEEVKRVLNIDIAKTTLKMSSCLSERFELDRIFLGLPQHKELFYLNDQPLPCILESDYSLHDNWLIAENNYPLYFSLYRTLLAKYDMARMLEIGVRTGYQSVVFARACQDMKRVFYMGVDPNLYVNEGIDLASKSLKTMRELYMNMDFALFEGYSWEKSIQRSLKYSGPFDIIHIDGDHSLRGKLIDLELSRRLVAPEGLILVDDYDHHPIIQEAVKKSIAGGWFTAFTYVPTLRGLAILQ